MKQLGAHLQARFASRRLVDRKVEDMILLDEANHPTTIRKAIEIGQREHGRAAIRVEHFRELWLLFSRDEQYMRKRCTGRTRCVRHHDAPIVHRLVSEESTERAS